MKKKLLFLFTFCFIQTLSAQDLLNEVFSKSFEIVNEKKKNEWYKGQILKKQRNGMGLLKMKGNSLYIGDFSKGSITGYGMLLTFGNSIISNCDSCTIYIGNWYNGKKSGMGTCYTKNGDVLYSGKFVEDEPADTYPSTNDYSLKYFSLFDGGDGDLFLGEINNGKFNGFGLTILNNGDLWMGNFKDGMKKGVGLYLMYDGEWETLNFTGDNYSVISSSTRYKDVNASLKQARKQSYAMVFDHFATATTSALGVASSIQSMKHNNNSSDNVSGGNSSEGASDNYGNNSTKSSFENTRKADCGSAWMTDSRTYSNYETQLVQMRTYPEKYDNYTSDYTNIQTKMQKNRIKWEARGCLITKSQYE